MTILAWGGFANGRIGAGSLHAIPNFKPIYAGVSSAAQSNLMMTEAAVQFSGLAQAFYVRFGKPLYVSEAYRAIGRQQSLYADYRAGRGNLAAYPGTSNHGWGRSLDLASGVNVNGSAENTWARQNAPRYGFYFTVPSEAWHVDYLGSPVVRVKSYLSNPNSQSASALPSTKAQQQWMNDARGEKLTVDGQNGPSTKAAVKRYQTYLRAYGYTGAIDGIWGPGVQAAHDKYHAARAAAAQNEGKPSAVNQTVKNRQTWLNSARGEKLVTDGKSGPATTAAFKRYQQFLRSYGYTGAIDGIWGSGMQKAHEKYYKAYHAPKHRARATLKKGSSGQDVKDLQALLNKYHGEKLTVDGKFGSGTKDAVVRFQKKSKLSADGIVGAATWDKLGQ